MDFMGNAADGSSPVCRFATPFSIAAACPTNITLMGSRDTIGGGNTEQHSPNRPAAGATGSRYENQKRRDWNTFSQYLRNHRPPLPLSLCSGAHILEFLNYLDQFGKTKVHGHACPYFGVPTPPAPCPCPLRQAWGSLDALVGRLRAAYEEHGGRPETNPFGARAVRLYLREVRDYQAKARGVSYDKKRKRSTPNGNNHNNRNKQNGSRMMPLPTSSS